MVLWFVSCKVQEYLQLLCGDMLQFNSTFFLSIVFFFLRTRTYTSSTPSSNPMILRVHEDQLLWVVVKLSCLVQCFWTISREGKPPFFWFQMVWTIIVSLRSLYSISDRKGACCFPRYTYIYIYIYNYIYISTILCYPNDDPHEIMIPIPMTKHENSNTLRGNPEHFGRYFADPL